MQAQQLRPVAGHRTHAAGQLREAALHVPPQGVAGRGEVDARAAADEQRGADGFLQPADSVADGGG